MSNDNLKQALVNAGLTPEQLADRLQVDPKTVRRWLTTGRAPYRRNQARIAEVLQSDVTTLWPSLRETAGTEAGSGEVSAVLIPKRDGPLDWRELAAGAQRRIDLLGLTLGSVITEGDPALLAKLASSGCQVRVLVSGRDSVHLAIAEQELRPHARLTDRPMALTAELDRVTAMLRPNVQRREIELRTFAGAGPYQVLIFDDQALMTPRIDGVPADQTPSLHLTRAGSGGFYDSFSKHFETIWRTAEPIR